MFGNFDHPLLDYWWEQALRNRDRRGIARALRVRRRNQAARITDRAAGDAPAVLPPLENPIRLGTVDGTAAVDASHLAHVSPPVSERDDTDVLQHKARSDLSARVTIRAPPDARNDTHG